MLIAVTVFVAATVVAAALVLRTGVVVVRVDGASMTPTYRPGDRVVAVRRWLLPRVRRGHVVVLWSPVRAALRSGAPQYIIKRVAALPGDPHPGGAPGETVAPACLFVLGDGESSLDSRAFGAVPRHLLVGRVVSRIPGDGRSQPAAGA